MAFGEDWRQRRIVHRTPGGKLTRVKISSLPAEEQQKYNPNRYKRLGADTMMSPDDFEQIQKKEYESGQIFDFYVQVTDEESLENIEEGKLLLATTNGILVPKIFTNDEKQIIKLNNVPMDAVKKVILTDDMGDVDYDNIDNAEFEDIDKLEGNDRYEKIKFNEGEIYKIDIAPYIEYVDKYVDNPNIDDEEINEGFYSYYYIGETI
jgi:hypothetical protein